MMLVENTAELRAKKAAYMRAYYQRVNGSKPVKGVTINCSRCGAETEKQHVSHDWCAACVRPAQLERRRKKREAKGSEPVGITKTCKECGASFQKEHKRQFYCPTCNQLSARDYLPSQRARVIKYQSERNKRRRREIPAVAISGRMSAGISSSLKDGKGGRSWEALVGFTVVDLMAHLERQFLPGMSWDNRGEWHIDHIRPLCSFEFQTPDCPQFREAWALSNLRPLWAADNIRKGGRRDLLL